MPDSGGGKSLVPVTIKEPSVTYEVVSYEAFSTGRSTRSDAVVARITPKPKRIGCADAVLYCHVGMSGKIVATCVTADKAQ